jgi:hypothetical protein
LPVPAPGDLAPAIEGGGRLRGCRPRLAAGGDAPRGLRGAYGGPMESVFVASSAAAGRLTLALLRAGGFEASGASRVVGFVLTVQHQPTEAGQVWGIVQGADPSVARPPTSSWPSPGCY